MRFTFKAVADKATIKRSTPLSDNVCFGTTAIVGGKVEIGNYATLGKFPSQDEAREVTALIHDSFKLWMEHNHKDSFGGVFMANAREVFGFRNRLPEIRYEVV